MVPRKPLTHGSDRCDELYGAADTLLLAHDQRRHEQFANDNRRRVWRFANVISIARTNGGTPILPVSGDAGTDFTFKSLQLNAPIRRWCRSAKECITMKAFAIMRDRPGPLALAAAIICLSPNSVAVGAAPDFGYPSGECSPDGYEVIHPSIRAERAAGFSTPTTA
jgi:hypothetical protein